MGGSGGGPGRSSTGGSFYTSHDLQELRRAAQERLNQSRLEAEVNDFLHKELASVNDRDVDLINSHLERIEDALEDEGISTERLLFGGSVAKHTFVDGLSDVDCLVILPVEHAGGTTPQEVKERLAQALRSHLPMTDIEELRTGELAVTLLHRDGTEIQLLPAIEVRGEVAVSAPDGQSWSRIRPQLFSERLTTVNKSQGGSVVPTIKLAKALLAQVLGSRAPKGYHLEALAVRAFEDYSGPRTPKQMLLHLIDHSSRAVLHPIRDVTGQTAAADEDLGPSESPARRSLARRLSSIGRRLDSANSVSDWETFFGE